MKYLSLFSGMESAHLAWHPMGWECVGVAEIEPNACAVLAHRLPHVPNLGSVTEITDERIAALGPFDVLIGGSPCQDLSVAGKRKGLAGARSSLFHQQMRIFDAARHLCGTRWLVWENVPGAFSSNGGRDFAVVVGAMAGCEVTVPRDGWGTEGVVLGANGLVEYGVLDAQWFGVAQRRRRVFAVLDTGNWSDRSPVLLERDSLRGDSPPRREAGKVAPTIPSRSTAGGGLGTDFDCDGGLIPEVARCITTGEAKRQDWETCTIIPATAHTLRADGFDASEDGTGRRGTPLVPVSVALRGREGGGAIELGDDVAFALRASQGGGDKPHVLAFQTRGSNIDVGDITGTIGTNADRASGSAPMIAFCCKDHGADAGELAPTLRAMGHGESHANAGGQVADAYMADDYKEGTFEEADAARPLTTSADRTRAAPIAATAMAVRRLTPRECERLQGVIDDWTLVPNAKGKPMADGPRYKLCGNGFAVPVIRWIGEQIQRATAESRMEQTA